MGNFPPPLLGGGKEEQATNQERADSLLIRLYTLQYCFVRLNLTWPGLPI
jgi:hypothetical protein